MKDRKKNIVWSTNPDYRYEYEGKREKATLPPAQQDLRVRPDRKQRAGKTVTLITGFVGKYDDQEALLRKLKAHCACGGTCKDGEMLLQGNFVTKAAEFLKKEGYRLKIAGV